MGQDEILKLLGKHKKQWFTPIQIKNILNAGNSSTSKSLMRLRICKEVNYKANDNSKTRVGFIYSFKRIN